MCVKFLQSLRLMRMNSQQYLIESSYAITTTMLFIEQHLTNIALLCFKIHSYICSKRWNHEGSVKTLCEGQSSKEVVELVTSSSHTQAEKYISFWIPDWWIIYFMCGVCKNSIFNQWFAFISLGKYNAGEWKQSYYQLTWHGCQRWRKLEKQNS